MKSHIPSPNHFCPFSLEVTLHHISGICKYQCHHIHIHFFFFWMPSYPYPNSLICDGQGMSKEGIQFLKEMALSSSLSAKFLLPSKPSLPYPFSCTHTLPKNGVLHFKVHAELGKRLLCFFFFCSPVFTCTLSNLMVPVYLYWKF